MRILRRADGTLCLVASTHTLLEGEEFVAHDSVEGSDFIVAEADRLEREERSADALRKMADLGARRSGKTGTGTDVLDPTDPARRADNKTVREARHGLGLDVYAKMSAEEARGGTAHFGEFLARLRFDPAYRAERVAMAGRVNRADDAAYGTGVQQYDQADGSLQTRTLAEGATATGGALVPPQYLQELLDIARAEAVVLKAGVVMRATNTNLVNLPTFTTAAVASWISENGAITPTDQVFGTQAMSVSKLGAGTKISNEMIQDGDPSIIQVVQEDLGKVIALALDLGMLEGTGTAPQIRGFKNTSGLTASPNVGTNGFSASTGGAATNALDYLMDAKYALNAVNITDEDRWSAIFHPRFLNSVRKVKDSTGNYILSNSNGYNAPLQHPSILNVPYYMSSQLAITETQGASGALCNSVYLGRFYESMLFVNGGFTIDMTQESADATNSAFWSDQTWIRAKQRVGFLVRRPAGICRITGFLA